MDLSNLQLVDLVWLIYQNYFRKVFFSSPLRFKIIPLVLINDRAFMERNKIWLKEIFN